MVSVQQPSSKEVYRNTTIVNASNATASIQQPTTNYAYEVNAPVIVNSAYSSNTHQDGLSWTSPSPQYASYEHHYAQTPIVNQETNIERFSPQPDLGSIKQEPVLSSTVIKEEPMTAPELAPSDDVLLAAVNSAAISSLSMPIL